MIKSIYLSIAGAVFAATAFSAVAGPKEVAHKTADGASAVAGKVDTAVKHGARKTTGSVEHGMDVASHAVSKTAKKLGLPPARPSSTPPATSGDPQSK